MWLRDALPSDLHFSKFLSSNFLTSHNTELLLKVQEWTFLFLIAGLGNEHLSRQAWRILRLILLSFLMRLLV